MVYFGTLISPLKVLNHWTAFCLHGCFSKVSKNSLSRGPPVICDPLPFWYLPGNAYLLGTIHLRGQQFFTIFFPYPPTISIPAKCLLRHADILNGWSLSFWGSELLSNPFSFILVWCTFFLIQSSILVGWLVSIPHNRSYCFSSRQKYESAR